MENNNLDKQNNGLSEEQAKGKKWHDMSVKWAGGILLCFVNWCCWFYCCILLHESY